MKLTKTDIFIFVVSFIVLSQIVLRLDAIPVLDFAFSGLRILILCAAIIYYSKHFYITKLEILLGIYGLLVLALTLMFSPETIIKCMSHIFNVFILLCIFKYFNTVQILRFFSIIFSIFVYLNFILIILYPNGQFVVDGSTVFLLGGNYNQMGSTLLVGITTNFLYSRYARNKYLLINSILLGIIALFSVINVGSMTSAVGITLLMLFIPVSYFKISRQLLKIGFILILMVNIFLLYLQMDIENNLITWFIEDVLKKDLTFSDRVRVWGESIDMISESFLFGYGLRTLDWFDYNFGVLTPHNFILSTLLKGGIVLLIILVVIIIYAVKESNKQKSAVVNILHMGCCSLLLMMTMETYPIELIFYLILLLGYIENIPYTENSSEHARI